MSKTKKLSNAVKRDRTEGEKHAFKMDAFLKGKRVFFTVPNGNPKETAKPFIRLEGKLVYGNYRDFREYGKSGKQVKNTQATGNSE